MDAWRNVEPRVAGSKDPKVRAAASAFARDAHRNIRELQRALRAGRFKFAPQHGVLKRERSKPGKPKKDPRPIVVAPIGNRIVQRAVLDICQSDERKVSRRLGLLPKIIATPTSVGGLPGRGVPEAVALISGAITNGARWFVRSDLKKFFQTIPKPRVEEFLRANISDTRFVDLFMQALATELDNEDEVREHIQLFPLRDVGVPQGSSLSALCANIVLSELDAELNGRGIVMVRYLDDFVILGRSKKAVLKTWNRAVAILKSLGMECHDPNAGTGKAAMGEVANGLEFLSFHIDDKHIYPSTGACIEFMNDLHDTIRDAKKAISAVKDEPRRAEPRFVQSLVLLDRKIRGWGDAFRATTMRLLLAQLDAKIDKILAEYLSWFSRVRRGRSMTHQRRLTGIALLIDTETNKTVRVSGAAGATPST